VNIINLVKWGRKCGRSKDKVRTVRNVAELRAYTKETGNVFSNTLHQDDGNVFLRHLLRKIFVKDLLK
jgi:hypothetical protein